MSSSTNRKKVNPYIPLIESQPTKRLKFEENNFPDNEIKGSM